MKKNLKVDKFCGFSLVEVLVVVSIIAILASIGGVAYANVQKKGRDAKRQADLKIIQVALEQYNADLGFYPGSGQLIIGSTLHIGGGGKFYLETVPTDPQQSNAQYYYRSFPFPCDNTNTDPNIPLCTDYCLSANLETAPTLVNACTPETSRNYAVGAP